MRRLAFLPLVMLVFACTDSTLVQPEEDLTIAASAHDRGRDARMEYTFQFRLGEGLAGLPGPVNGFVLEGELEGYGYFSGSATLDESTGRAEGTGPAMLVLTAPKVGQFACTWSAEWEDFFAVVYGKWHACKGYGDFKGMKLYSTNTNENSDPGVTDAVAVIWGALGPRNGD